MADTKISLLEQTVLLTGAEFLPLVQPIIDPKNNKKVTINDIMALAPVQSVNGMTGAVVISSGDMVLASVQTNSGAKTFLDTTFLLRNVANTFNGSFVNINSANRIYTLPNASGTVALTSDIPASSTYWTTASGSTLTGPNVIDGGGNDLTFNLSPTLTLSAVNEVALDAPNITFVNGIATFELSNTSYASINIPHGVAPTTPNDGDFWTTSAGGLFGRINGATINYGAAGGASWLLASGGTATGTNTFAMGAFPFIMTTGVTTGTGATAGHQLVGNSLTTGNLFDASGSSVTTGSLGVFTSTSTVIDHTAGTNGLVEVLMSGANSTASKTAIGLYSKVINTGTTNTNIAGYFEASGGTTNLALRTLGNVFIANASGDTPTASTRLDVRGTTTGSESAFRVANSNNLLPLLYTNTGLLSVADNVTISGSRLLFFNGGNGQINLDANSTLIFRANTSTTAQATGYYRFFNTNGSYTHTTGTGVVMGLEMPYAPASGAGTFIGLNISGAISPSGGSNHIVYGARYNPSGTFANLATHLAFSSTVGNWAMEGSATTLTLGGGATASELRFLEPSAGGSSYVGFKSPALAGNTVYDLPNAFPSVTGYVLSSTDAGVMSWVANTATTINSLNAAGGTNDIDNGNYTQTWRWNTLNGTNGGINLQSTSTAGTATTNLMNMGLSGANSNSSVTSVGISISNVKTGTSSVNIGLDLYVLSGATNYALRVSDGHVNFSNTAGCNLVLDTTVGTKFGTSTSQKMGWWNATPVVQQAGLTAITHTAPGTPDYAIQDLTAGGFGFVTKDEGNTVLSVIKAMHDAMKLYGMLS